MSNLSSPPVRSKFWYLSRHPLLFERATQDLEWLSQVCHLKQIPKGQMVYLPGDPACTVYILKEGRVRISRVSPDGKQMTLMILETGTLFGEMAMLEDDAAYENLAETLDDTFLCLIAKADFEAFLKRHPDLSFQLTRLVGQRMREIENKLEAMVFLSVEERLYQLLRHLATQFSQPTPDGHLIDMKLTHEDIGYLINASRPTVSVMMSRLQQAQSICKVKSRILVSDHFLSQSA